MTDVQAERRRDLEAQPSVIWPSPLCLTPAYIQQKPDFFATQRHYVDHLAPVYRMLRERAGTFYTLADLIPHAKRRGINAVACPTKDNDLSKLIRQHAVSRAFGARLNPGTNPIVIASAGDCRQALEWNRPVVWIEHGNGQRYARRHPSYPGGGGVRLGVNLFLLPGPYAVQSERRGAAKESKIVGVGCAKMDSWHPPKPKPVGNPPVVALGTHFDCKFLPETRSAFLFFQSVFSDIARRYCVLGHAHPRAWEIMKPRYEQMGIEPVEDFTEVLDRADLFCTDNSSTLYEFASLDRPVVALNAPLYRRGIQHGLRFWEYIPGYQCDHPNALVDTIGLALEDNEAMRATRRRAVEYTYSYTDGNATSRAVQEILRWQSEAQ